MQAKSGPKQPHLRPTTWPGIVLEPGPALQLEAVKRVGHEVSCMPGDAKPVQDEIYLRAMRDVDVRDPDALVAFVAQHGRLVPADRDRTSDLAWHPKQYWIGVLRYAVELGLPHPRKADASDLEHPWHFYVAEAAVRVHSMQRVAAHIEAWVEGDYERTAWTDCPSDEAAWARFTNVLNAALRPWSPRVMPGFGGDDPAVVGFVEGEGFVEEQPAPTVYQVAALQVLNHLTEQAEYRRCPNCQRLFYRALGRSQHYNRTTGVTYCSRSCGKAFAERARRRRIKEGKR